MKKKLLTLRPSDLILKHHVRTKSLRFIHPVEKDGVMFCPKCKVELIKGHFIGMQSPGKLGNEGDTYDCPKCGGHCLDITICRD
jgi:hypothetical protein